MNWKKKIVIPQNLPSILSRHSIHPYSRIPQELINKLSPRQSTQTRVWHFSDPDGLLTPPMVFILPHMLQRFPMSNFKPHKSGFLRQLLRWLKISCIGQKSQLWSLQSKLLIFGQHPYFEVTFII